MVYARGMSSQQDRVRERFTRTAQQFASFSLTKRTAEAERLADLAAAQLPDAARTVALDVACGPGTFTTALASRVKFVHGLDLTPALLAQARSAAEAAGISNIVFHCGDALALPFRAAAFDLVCCGYSLHHMPHPAQAVAEMMRVVQPRGCVALVDLIVPPGADAALNNRIERARDNSHTRTLAAEELVALVERTGLRIIAQETGERWRNFDEWLRIGGWEPGDEAYRATRALLDADLGRNASGFHPRLSADGALEFLQVSLFVFARPF